MPQSDLATIWRQSGPKERIRAFKSWLGDSQNQPNLFIVDDLDGLQDETLIKEALPREAQIILYSSRDPSIVRGLGRDSNHHHVSNMEVDEMASLMMTELQRGGHGFQNASFSEEELQSIVSIVDGHPLGACRAVFYILDVLAQMTDVSPAGRFLDICNGPDWEARRRFLDYKPRIGRSIMETFEVSLQRVRDRYKSSLELLELLAFISNPECSLDFRKLLGLKRPWLQDLRSVLPDYAIFATEVVIQGEYLAELENVSLGTRLNVSDSLQIHPLWLECIRQRADPLGRLRWMRQILLICHGSWARSEESVFEILLPFVYNVMLVATRFGIHLSEIAESQDLRDWIQSINSNAEDPGADVKDPEVDAKDPEVDRLTALSKNCQETLKEFMSLNFSNLINETFEQRLQQFSHHLRQLKSIEDQLDQGLCVLTPPHVQVYDALIKMAPVFRHRNPFLEERLRNRRASMQHTRPR